MKHYLIQHCKRQRVQLQLKELDIQRNSKDNFVIGTVQKKWLNRIEAGDFDFVLCSPPCSTFSRAPWANLWGPRPIRSFLHPKGFPWLKYSRKLLAQAGNCLAKFSFDAMKLQLSQENKMALKEQPEDLGALKSGPWKCQRPSSMWQFPEHEHIMALKGVRSAAIFSIRLWDSFSETNQTPVSDF